MIILRYIYSDGFTNRVNLVELFGRGRLLIEHFARLHGGIIAVEAPSENRPREQDYSEHLLSPIAAAADFASPKDGTSPL